MNWDREVFVTLCYWNQGHPPLAPHSDHTSKLFRLLDQVVAESRFQSLVSRILVDFRHDRIGWFPCCRLWDCRLVMSVFELMTPLVKKFHHWF